MKAPDLTAWFLREMLPSAPRSRATMKDALQQEEEKGGGIRLRAKQHSLRACIGLDSLKAIVKQQRMRRKEEGAEEEEETTTNDSDRVRAEKAVAAASILYPIHYISPGWSVSEEKARKKIDNGLDPTSVEVHAAEVGVKKIWSDVVKMFLNPSEFGHGKGQLDPNVRPIDLLLGGLIRVITVLLRECKG
jgi:hypothetical protein